MSTWLQDIEKKDPKLADAYRIIGNQPIQCIKNMVSALEMCSLLNTPDDYERLLAAKYILKNRK